MSGLDKEIETLQNPNTEISVPTFPEPYPYLNPLFLEAMNDIARLGLQKYGENSFQHRVHVLGQKDRWMDRVTVDAIFEHSGDHFADYIAGIPHDVFHTLQHQLAAVAFNAMMEAELSGVVHISTLEDVKGTKEIAHDTVSANKGSVSESNRSTE